MPEGGSNLDLQVWFLFINASSGGRKGSKSFLSLSSIVKNFGSFYYNEEIHKRLGLRSLLHWLMIFHTYLLINNVVG